MHPVRKRRVLFLLAWMVLLGGVVALVLYAMRQHISLFYTPTEVAAGRAPLAHDIRVGGMVEKGSVRHLQGGRVIQFMMTDFKHHIQVRYQGVLPDLFREGQGVVVNGQLTSGTQLLATDVLAKHDATYMAPEIRKMLQSETAKHVA